MSGLTCACCNAEITGDEWDSCYECSAPLCETCVLDLPTVPYSEGVEVEGEDEDVWGEIVCGKCQGLS